MISKNNRQTLQRIKLSDNFTLWELMRSRYLSLVDMPSSEIVDRLKLLVGLTLQPVREEFGPIRINSGFRGVPLNTRLGGAEKSDHTFACAVDFVPLQEDPIIVYAWCAENLPYRQLIWYKKKHFIHISINHKDHPVKHELKVL